MSDPDLGAFPPVELFVRNLVARVDTGYPKAVAIIAKALAMAGAHSSQALAFLRNPKTKAAFLVGCCAEELAALDLDLRNRRGREFVRELIAQLQPHARPLSARTVSSDLRRLLADFRANPCEMRLQTACFMLHKSGLAALRKRLEASAVAALAVECSVLTDGIAGTLLDSLPPRQQQGGGAGASIEDADSRPSQRRRPVQKAATENALRNEPDSRIGY